MASCDEIYLTIHGKGGHAALPHTTIDPIYIASQIVVQAQSIVSRSADPTVPSVLSFGHIEGIGATNIIPSVVHLKGTFRTMHEPWRKNAHRLLTELVDKICEAHGARADLKIEVGYPFLVNDEKTTAQAKKAVLEIVDLENIVDLPIRMTAEDFSYYSQKVPATFFRIGVKNPLTEANYGLHNSRFNPDENAIKIGMKAFLAIVFGA
jgi:amidohydrolase